MLVVALRTHTSGPHTGGLQLALSIEWFCFAYFSENWATCAYVTSSADVFSLAFGRNLDAYSPSVGVAADGGMHRFDAHMYY